MSTLIFKCICGNDLPEKVQNFLGDEPRCSFQCLLSEMNPADEVHVVQKGPYDPATYELPLHTEPG